jgi:hypothetical protein
MFIHIPCHVHQPLKILQLSLVRFESALQSSNLHDHQPSNLTISLVVTSSKTKLIGQITGLADFKLTGDMQSTQRPCMQWIPKYISQYSVTSPSSERTARTPFMCISRSQMFTFTFLYTQRGQPLALQGTKPNVPFLRFHCRPSNKKVWLVKECTCIAMIPNSQCGKRKCIWFPKITSCIFISGYQYVVACWSKTSLNHALQSYIFNIIMKDQVVLFRT